MANVTLSKKRLFEVITAKKNWFDGFDTYPSYCTKGAAAVLKHRHLAGTLGDDSYDALALHFGFIKETIYTKN